METNEARLASFAKAHPIATKKGASNSKSTKTLKWPHKTPSPAQLAAAGFFFEPSTSRPDGVTCFLCHKTVDGWEQDDDPVKEHLSLIADCGWAVNVAIEQDMEAGVFEGENPLSARMMEARKSTFNELWPHESKRGWTCKTQKLVDAGWYYCPTQESDDFVRCAYCGLSLDGWEPKDNPYIEHQKRSPGCPFFRLTEGVKPTRAKKGRASKASRMSTQSNMAAMSESQSMIDDNVGEEDSTLTSASNRTISSSVPKTKRKFPKAKKGRASKQAMTRSVEPDEAVQTSSFVEPEDDTFDVKNDAVGSKYTRGKKRKTTELELDTGDDDSVSKQAPPVKRRSTRTRSSTVKPQTITDLSQQEGNHDDLSVTDAEVDLSMMPTSKKRGKGSKKRASSRVRKASATSTASTASLRAPILDNDEIDAALEADLERPLTDDENNDGMPFEAPPKTRRLTRTRPNARKASATTAPVQKGKGKGSRKAVLAKKETLKESTLSIQALQENNYTDDLSIHSQLIEKVENSIETDVNQESVLPDAESSVLDTTRSEPSIVELPQPEPEESPSILHAHQPGSRTQEEETQPEAAASEHLPTMSKDPVVPSPTPSPQSSDVENHPPSSRPSQTRPPLVQLSPSKIQTIRIPLAPSTPTASPSKRAAASRLQTTYSWTSIDLENIFHGSPQSRKDAVNGPLKATLSTPEKKMTVEEWIFYNAKEGEERLRNECERLVGILEKQGVQAMMSLEGIKCLE